jgi:hypothetical protein
MAAPALAAALLQGREAKRPAAPRPRELAGTEY